VIAAYDGTNGNNPPDGNQAIIEISFKHTLVR